MRFKTFLSISFLFCCALVTAQIVDDFEDGNLTNPDWLGQTDRFSVLNGELSLQDASNDSPSYLYLQAATSLQEETTWEFYVRTEFAPSSNNHAIVYLSASNPDLSADQLGYYLKVGGISGTDDALELYRQDGGSSSLILSGMIGAVANDPVQASIRLVRSTAGSWQLFTDYSGGTNYSLEAAAIDNTYSIGQYIGVRCIYTSSNATDNFFFDNFLVDPLYVDAVAPNLLSGTVLSPTEVQLQFDEALDATSAGLTANYSVDQGIGNPVSAELDGSDPSKVNLLLGNSLINGQLYTLNVQNIEDPSGNVLGSQNISITYVIPEAYDILINEVMASPPDGSVPGSLPEDVEYVELYNRSTKTLNLGGWTFSDAGTPQVLPAYSLAPGDYLILCDDSDLSLLAPYGEVLAIASFPALNNSGDALRLVTAEGLLVHQVNYTDDWYQDSEKDDGGWALELINPLAPCQGAINWRASNDLSGGTPGIENSVYQPAPDADGPTLLDLVYDPDLVAFELYFSETLDLSTVDESDFSIAPTLGGIDQVETLPENPQFLRLYLPDMPQAGITYEVRIANGALADCLGNSTDAELVGTFRIAETYDVLIHEIMAAPPDPASDVLLPAVEYIELYNRTDSPVNLSDWRFYANTSDAVFPPVSIEADGYLIVCAADAVDSLSAFGPIVGLEGFPGLTNSGSTLKIEDRNGTLIHRVPYTDEWYKSTAKISNGWSLEMVNALNYCAGVSNWQASDDLSGGTPGQINSVAAPMPDAAGPLLRYVLPPDSPGQIEVVFTEDLDLESASEITAFSIDNGVEVVGVELDAEAANRLGLLLFPDLIQGVVYTLSTTSTLKDCQGNPVETVSTTRFALPDPIAPGDLIINEVLFHPQVGGRDFVEVYNTTTDKIFDLNDLILANLSVDQDTSLVDPPSAFSFPGDYSVITESPTDILERYAVPNPSNLFQVSDFPTFPADAGNVTLYTRDESNLELIIDAFDYTDELHNALLDETRGVSLERLDAAVPASENSNWASAAQEIGYATPTGANSQSGLTPEGGVGTFTLESQTFSPDGDGFEDQLRVHYELEGNGFLANVRIFDAEGRLIKDLEQNKLLGATGTLVWDGDTAEGSRARIGIYIVWIELFRPDGKIEYQRLTGVLAARF